MLENMGEPFPTLLNVTLVYPEPHFRFWDFLCGRVRHIIVHIEALKFPSGIVSHYAEDPKARARLRQWVQQLWKAKDQIINQLIDAGEIKLKKRR